MESHYLLLSILMFGLTLIGVYGIYQKVFPKYILAIPLVVWIVVWGLFGVITHT